MLTTTYSGGNRSPAAFAIQPSEWDRISPARHVVFELRFENHAWGRKVHGLYVDRLGAIYTYDAAAVTEPKMPTPRWMKRARYFSRPGDVGRRLMALDYDRAERVHASGLGHRVGTVDAATLREMYNRVPLAGAGSLENNGFGGRDAGTFRFLAYYLDARSMHHKAVLLHQSGDYPVRNTSAAAALLAQWIDDLARPPGGSSALSYCTNY